MHTKINDYIDMCRIAKGHMTKAELAALTDQTPQALTNKYKRNSFKLSDLEKIAEAMDADLQILFIDKETGKPIL